MELFRQNNGYIKQVLNINIVKEENILILL